MISPFFLVEAESNWLLRYWQERKLFRYVFSVAAWRRRSGFSRERQP